VRRIVVSIAVVCGMPRRRATDCAVEGSSCIGPRALAEETAPSSKLLSCRCDGVDQRRLRPVDGVA
jgi:hypothetical protein